MVQETFPSVIYALFLQDFPESLVLVLLIFSLAKIKHQTKPILCIALLQALTSVAMRQIPIVFGVHSVLLIFTLAIYTRLLTRARLSSIFLSVFLSFAALVAIESAYSKPLLNLTGLTYEKCFANPFLRAAFALPGEVILLALALGVNHYNKKRGATC